MTQNPEHPSSSADATSKKMDERLLDYSKLDERVSRLRAQFFQLLVALDQPGVSTPEARKALTRLRQTLHSEIVPDSRFQEVEQVPTPEQLSKHSKEQVRRAYSTVVDSFESQFPESPVSSEPESSTVLFTPLHPLLSDWLGYYLPPRTHSRAKRKVLNVGSGPGETVPSLWSEPGWVQTRLDADPSVKPDLLLDLKHPDFFIDSVYDAIFMSHTLEHLNYLEGFQALIRLYDGLVPGGVLCVVVPNIQVVSQYVAKGSGHETLYETEYYGGITPIDILYGLQSPDISPLMHHRYGYTPTTLARLLREVLPHHSQATVKVWSLDSPTDEDRCSVGWLECWGVVRKPR